MGKLIFLDFDGVLRRVTSSPSSFDLDCLENFESAVRQCSVSKIVISSTWRLAMSLSELRARFSPDIASRIIGVTPECLEEVKYVRHAEILTYLAAKKITAMPWVAVDDDPSYFPAGSSILLTNPQNGFDAECMSRLVNILHE